MSKIIKLYHGSENIIEKPLFGKGKPDYEYMENFMKSKMEKTKNSLVYLKCLKHGHF